MPKKVRLDMRKNTTKEFDYKEPVGGLAEFIETDEDNVDTGRTVVGNGAPVSGTVDVATGYNDSNTVMNTDYAMSKVNTGLRATDRYVNNASAAVVNTTNRVGDTTLNAANQLTYAASNVNNQVNTGLRATDRYVNNSSAAVMNTTNRAGDTTLNAANQLTYTAINANNNIIRNIDGLTNNANDLTHAALSTDKAAKDLATSMTSLLAAGVTLFTTAKKGVMFIIDSTGKIKAMFKGKTVSDGTVVMRDGKIITANGPVSAENVVFTRLEGELKDNLIKAEDLLKNEAATLGDEAVVIGEEAAVIGEEAAAVGEVVLPVAGEVAVALLPIGMGEKDEKEQVSKLASAAGCISGVALVTLLEATTGYSPFNFYSFDPISNKFGLLNSVAGVHLYPSVPLPTLCNSLAKMADKVPAKIKAAAHGVNSMVKNVVSSGAKIIKGDFDAVANDARRAVSYIERHLPHAVATFLIIDFYAIIPVIPIACASGLLLTHVASRAKPVPAPHGLSGLGEIIEPFSVYRPDRKKHILMAVIIICIVIVIMMMYYIETYYNKLHTDGKKSTFIPGLRVTPSLFFLK